MRPLYIEAKIPLHLCVCLEIIDLFISHCGPHGPFSICFLRSIKQDFIEGRYYRWGVVHIIWDNKKENEHSLSVIVLIYISLCRWHKTVVVFESSFSSFLTSKDKKSLFSFIWQPWLYLVCKTKYNLLVHIFLLNMFVMICIYFVSHSFKSLCAKQFVSTSVLFILYAFLTCMFSFILHIEGILSKGPYLPCVSMAGRAILAGYLRYESEIASAIGYVSLVAIFRTTKLIP